ncbi:hypothetical protein KUTeg_002973, partial [Tegillarca granosa]
MSQGKIKSSLNLPPPFENSAMRLWNGIFAPHAVAVAAYSDNHQPVNQLKIGPFYLPTIAYLLLSTALVRAEDEGNEDVEYDKDKPVIDPSLCEVCKYLVVELQTRLDETGRNKEVLHLGHGLDKKKKVKYNKGELRLIEAMQDPHICERIIEYNVHKERKGSLRFAKGRSQTMQTLHNLVTKGVKVDIGIPPKMWDYPSAEILAMQRKCYKMVEDYEDDVEEWYYNHQNQNILDYLCRERVLKNKNQKCLDEVFVPKDDDDEEDNSKNDQEKQEEKENKNEKGETEQKSKEELNFY